MSTEWYYMGSKGVVGPLSDNQLRSHAANGDITAKTILKRKDDLNWMAATNVHGLFNKSKANQSNLAENSTTSIPTNASSSQNSKLLLANNQTQQKSQSTGVVGLLILIVLVITGLGAYFVVHDINDRAIKQKQEEDEQKRIKIQEDVDRAVRNLNRTLDEFK